MPGLVHPRAAGIASACWLVGLAGCGATSGRTSSSPPPRPSVVRKVAVGGAPIGLLAYGGQVWVADAEGNRLLRIQPATGRVTARVPVGKTPLRIVAFRGSLWSTDWKGGTVSRVSPSRLRRVATVPVGPEPEGIVPLGADLWVVSEQAGEVVRIVPGNRHAARRVHGGDKAGLAERVHGGDKAGVAERVHVGDQPRQITAAGANLWVSVFGDDSVVEVDPRTERVVARVHVCGGPQGLAYSAGQVWVGCTNSGQLVDVDPGAHRVVRRLAYQAADGVAPAGSLLRVTSDDGPSTALLDPRTGELSHRVRLAGGFISDANADVVEAGGAAWVSSPDEGSLYRVGGS